MPEDSPHGRFAKEDAPQKICHTTGETYECDGEFERKRRTNVCNSADVEDSPHNGDRLGSRGGESWVGMVGVRGGEGWVGGVGLSDPNPPPPQTQFRMSQHLLCGESS